MKITYRNLAVISLILFTCSILVAGYLLYNLPGDVNDQLQLVDKNQLRQVSSVTTKLSIVVSLGFLNGLVAIAFLLMGNKMREGENSTYTDYASEKEGVANVTASSDQKDYQQALEARFHRTEQLLRTNNQSELKHRLEYALRTVCSELEACQGAIFLATEVEGKRCIELTAGYAYYLPESQSLIYELGEGLAGQVAKEGKLINFSSVPDNYITILSGLGKSSPNHLIIAPIKEASDNSIIGVMEIASFKVFTEQEEEYINRISLTLAAVIGDNLSVRASV